MPPQPLILERIISKAFPGIFGRFSNCQRSLKTHSLDAFFLSTIALSPGWHAWVPCDVPFFAFATESHLAPIQKFTNLIPVLLAGFLGEYADANINGGRIFTGHYALVFKQCGEKVEERFAKPTIKPFDYSAAETD